MITIDFTEFREVQGSLNKLHRAVLPNAVRFTLNDLAFDVKKNTLIPAVDKTMILRNQPFFKKYSGVDKASGYEINKMYSEVGFIPSGNATESVERLKQQDEGGTLQDRNMVPLDKSRIGSTLKGKVRGANYMNKIKLAGHVTKGDKQGLIRGVTRSRISSGGAGKGVSIIYGEILYEILGYKRLRKTNSIKLNIKPIYSYKKNRKITVKPHRFISKSAMESSNKCQELFNKNLQTQISKFANR
jgi:curved DNA-binding protein CbpA